MPVTEIQRTGLVNRLVEVIGEEHAETLMLCILPEGRDQLATKDDLKALEIQLRGEFAEFKSEITGQFAEFNSEIRAEIAKVTRHFAFMLVGFMITIWATMIPIALAT